jgi:AhpD family alkylhydroperoxidase
MSNRLNIPKTDPEVYKAMYELEKYWETTSLTQLQKEMIRMRASQINGCTFCIDMHTRDARKAGETERRIYALNAWRETPFFTEEERAILALTEAVTLISKAGVPSEVYEQAIKILGEQKTLQVIMGASIINAWNRLGISTGLQPAL